VFHEVAERRVDLGEIEKGFRRDLGEDEEQELGG
jgi:hypothetical protein